jgi:hypothetical protein
VDAFSYLSVLLSIILGLAIQQVMQGYRALILARGRVRFAWVPLLWSGLILLIVVQHWWASFGLESRTAWTFADFLVTLLVTALIYMLAAIVLPDVPAGADVDLDTHYWRERKALFALFSAAVVASVLREWQLEGRLPEPRNLLFHALFLGVGLLGLLSRDRRVHAAIALGLAGVFAVYVALLFTRLQAG